eukprot:CAMPEP_0183573268 /NCGR_PEP_ID=MMETSP0371-20130417/130558_1 /TAXON_ID=268820 /ORGANISM="Peridinium aciculiferum, Strain PAER-2" /LENGTH=71 /DNA_ID=CAMNT_0025783215 /DNA_START=110 /DNA_END=322 /DNA_ORIENTATION=+
MPNKKSRYDKEMKTNVNSPGWRSWSLCGSQIRIIITMSTWQTSQFKARILVENCIPLFPTGNNIDKRTSSS